MRKPMDPFSTQAHPDSGLRTPASASGTPGGQSSRSNAATAAPYRFGKRSLEELEGVHPVLVAVAHDALSVSAVDFGIFDGIRTIAEQREYVRTGVSQTLNSRHLKQEDGYGHAVDPVPWINGKYRWERVPCLAVARAFKWAAEKRGVARKIKWGGCWEFLSEFTDVEDAVDSYVARRMAQGKKFFVDLPHFEIHP